MRQVLLCIIFFLIDIGKMPIIRAHYIFPSDNISKQCKTFHIAPIGTLYALILLYMACALFIVVAHC